MSNVITEIEDEDEEQEASEHTNSGVDPVAETAFTPSEQTEDVAREAFEAAKAGVDDNIDPAIEGVDEHYVAMQCISNFLQHLHEKGTAEIKGAAATIRAVFERIV